MSQTIDSPTVVPDAQPGEEAPWDVPPSRARRAARTRAYAAPGRSGVKRTTGVVLIGVGVVAILFLAYLFSVSFLSEARSQSVLLAEFKTSLTLANTANVEPPTGGPVGLLQIPTLGLQKVIVQGIGADQTKQGPGHDPSTPMPGQVSNVVIVGRRSSFGAAFKYLNELNNGDQIIVYTRQGRFTYTVVKVGLLPLGTVAITDSTTDNRITLIAANPEYLWRDELVVVGTLKGQPLGAATNVTARPPGEEPGLSTGVNPLAAILLWGELFVLSVIATWILYRRWVALPTYVLTTPIVIATMYLLFENLARLLPPSL